MISTEMQNQTQPMNIPNSESNSSGSRLLLNLFNRRYHDENLEKQSEKQNNKDKLLRRNHHATRAFDVINSLRKQKLFCDVILQADDGTCIEAHKMILAAFSPYFYEMFTSFQNRDERQIKLKGIDSSALELSIDYIYTAEVHITEKNAKVLLLAANILQLADVSDSCCNFLKAHLESSNCLGIREFADAHGCSELLKHADNYMEQHFLDFIKGNEFLNLSPEGLIKLIFSSNRIMLSEDKVFESVISWVNADVNTRKTHLAKLMKHLRPPLLSQEYFSQRIEKDSLVRSNMECQSFLIATRKYFSLENEREISLGSPKKKSKERYDQQEVLLIVGSNTNDSCRTVEYYNFEDEEWYRGSQLPTTRCCTGLSVLEGRIYVIGGSAEPFTALDTVDVYDKSADRWLASAKMKTPRLNHEVAVLGNCIYSVGGDDGINVLDSAEVYKPSEGKWEFISPMSKKRSRIGVGVLGGFLYVIGGFDAESQEYLSSAECYNPQKNEWKPIAEMSSRRANAGVGVLDGILYAVGGDDGKKTLKSVEAYNPKTNQWSSIADMKYCRYGAGVVTVKNMLHVVGGKDDNYRPLDSLETYSPKNNTWMTSPTSMGIARCCVSVAMIDVSIGPKVVLSGSQISEHGEEKEKYGNESTEVEAL